jgi:hypothetical protein
MSNTITTHLKGDNSHLEKELKESESMADGFAKRVTGMFAVIGTAIAGAFAVRTVVDFFKDAVQEATAAEEAMSKFTIMLRATNGEAGISKERIEHFATEMQKLTRFTDDETIAAAAMLMRFKSLQEDGFERTLKVSADMTSMWGGDLSSSAMQLGRALENPEHGTRILMMAGVKLDEEQRKQIKTFQMLGETAKAQELILGLLEERFSGAAEELDKNFTGSVMRVNQQLSDVKEEIGNSLLPVLQSLVPTLETGADAWGALGHEMAIAIEASNSNGGLSKTNEMLLDMITFCATAEDQWTALAMGIAKANTEGGIWLQQWGEAMAQRSMTVVEKFGAGLESMGMSGNLKASSGIIKTTMGIGDDKSDPLGLKATDKTLAEDMSRIQARIKETRDRLEADMKTRAAARSVAADPDAAPPFIQKDPFADIDVAEREREEFERTFEQLQRKRSRSSSEKSGRDAGFGQGSGGKAGKDDDIFEARFEDITALSSRVQAAAASTTPAKKIEQAIIDTGIKTVEAIDQLKAQLVPVKDVMDEQLDIMKSPDERFSGAQVA